MDSESVRMLRELASTVTEAAEIDHEESHFLVTRGDDSLAFQGEAFLLLRALGRRLATPALAGGGVSETEAEELIIQACLRTVHDGADAAVDWLTAAIDGEPKSYWFGVPVSAYCAAEQLELGSTRLLQHLPAHLSGLTDGMPNEANPFHSAQVLSCDVVAHDAASAEVVASDLLDQGMSLLRLLSDRRPRRLVTYVGIQPVDQPVFAGRNRTLILRHVASDGRPWPPYLYIADAMAKNEEHRSDWERRTIAACRWHNRAVSAGWPSASLVASFTALECLFVHGKSERLKGSMVATRVMRQDPHVPHLESVEEIGAWLEELYQRRNDAAHEGVSFANEIDADRLEQLTAASVEWAARHLDRFHRGGGVCTTFEEAHDGPHDDLGNADLGHDAGRSD